MMTEPATSTDSLVGRYFYSDADREWQGHVDAEVAPGVYLVELRSWMDGLSSAEVLVRLDDMTGWTFYDSLNWWRESVEDVQRRWERERDGNTS